MPAILVEDPDDLEGKETDTLAGALVADPTAAPNTAPEDDLADDVPEKYKGKTARELLDILGNQESQMGRQGQELGELRSQNGTLRGLVDQSLQLRDTGNAGRPDLEEDALNDDDFTLNPKDATQRTVRDETASLRDEVKDLKAGARNQRFANDFPDAPTDMSDPKFVQFVRGSTQRTALAAKAFANPKDIDYESAQDLWERYNDFKSMQPDPVVDPVVEGDDPAPIVDDPSSAPDTAPELVTGNSGGTPGVAASGKPIYSQTALNALQADNAELYWRDDTQKRIELARKEGRILQD